MTTPYGKSVRKLRIDMGLRLKDMADALEVQPAYLSAVEMGRKRITDDLVSKTISWLKGTAPESFDKDSIESIRLFVDSSQPEYKVKMTGFDDEQREMFVAFARKFQGLSADRKQDLKRLLEE